VRRKKGNDEIEILLWILFAGFAMLYAGSLVAHHATHYHFPGFFVRLFSLFAKRFLTCGVIYTIWQLSTEHKACPKCGRDSMIPPGSPKAQETRVEKH
jgi:hypothetical protein